MKGEEDKIKQEGTSCKASEVFCDEKEISFSFL